MARKAKEAETEVREEEDDIDASDFSVLEFEENLEDIEEPDLLPEKSFIGEIVEVVPTRNQAGTGYYYNQKIVIPVEQYPPDYDPENAPEGTPVYYRMVSVPKANDRRSKARVRRWVQTLGLPLNTNRIDVDEWVGRQVKITLQHQKNQDGSYRIDIKNVAAADA